MMQHKCDLIKDLLPLYADEVCSAESRKTVAEHIAGCSTCRSMLEKMNRQLVVNVNTDIRTLKRIKNRLRIERIVIGLLAAAVLGIGGYFGMFFLLNTDRTVDYEAYNLAECIYAEEDEEGNVWIVRQGPATEAWNMMINPRDAQGDYQMDAQMKTNSEYDKDELTGWGFTLKERRIDALHEVTLEQDTYNEWDKERTMYLDASKHQKINEIYYYDDVTGNEYLLWKRGD